MSANVLHRTALGVGLAFAIATTGCAEGAPPDSRTTEVGTVEDLCARTNEVPKLTEADGESLDVLGLDYMPDWTGKRYVGRLAVNDGDVVVELSPLPDDMTDSLVRALGDPLVACAVGRNGWTTRVVITTGEDNGHFNMRDDDIQWDRTASNDPDKKLASEVGAASVGIPHEVMHGYVDNWWEAAAEGDGSITQGLQQLHDIFKKELESGVEQFRVSEGKDFRKALLNFKHEVNERKYPELANALQQLADRMNVDQGLIDIMWDKSGEDVPFPIRNRMQYLLEEAGNLERGRLDDNHFRDFQDEIKGLETIYRAFLEDYFAPGDESAMISHVVHNPRVGHPFDNFHEWVASLMNTMRFNPNGVARALGDLPFERRYNYDAAIQVLDALSAKASPELNRAIPFQKVLDGFSS